MTDLQKEQIKKIVYKFSNLANVNNENVCNKLILNLSTMNEEDVIDYLLVNINNLVETMRIKPEDVFYNIDLITSLSDKYSTKEDLMTRLNWLKSMNMMDLQMSLSDNHRLVIEAFDKFNQIIGTKFDAYYTGGLMGYLATNHPLERYHSDLDLFINEKQLYFLYELINESDEFEFISNMDNKEENGHEFKIQYKETPMSIGLFLFERKPNDEIVIKEYYHKDKNPSEELLVNEKHLAPNYAKMVFSNDIRLHNNTPYRMQSLESIYNAKKNSRPKDRYDASIIKDSVDLMVDYQLDTQKQDNYEVKAKTSNNSIITIMETKNLECGKHL